MPNFLLRNCRALAVAIVAALTPVVAKAAVIIDLVQTSFTTRDGTSGGSPLNFSGQIVVADDAFARGVNPSVFNNPSAGPFARNTDGLLNFLASARYGAGSPFLVTPLSTFLTPLPAFAPGGYVRNLALSLSPAAISGGVTFNDQETDYRLTLNPNGTFTGTLNTDRGGICGRSGNCSFSGLVLVSIPEPSTLAILALAGLGLAGALRLRSRPAA